MTTERTDQRFLQFLMALTIVAGGLVTFLIVNKEEYFPGLYPSHQVAHESAEHTTVLHDDSIVHAAEANEGAQHAPEKHEEEPKRSTVLATTNPRGRYVLIAGSFISKENAARRQQSISGVAAEFSPEITQVNLHDSTFFRIIATRSDSYKGLSALKEKLVTAGFADCWIGKNKE